MTALYRSREKIRVTLTLMPSAMVAVIAGSPARVAGILISTLGRSTILCSSAAWSMVACGVVGQPRVDLDGHAAVDVAGGLVDAGEQVAGVAHVVGGGLADGVVDGGAAGGQFVELLLVGGAVGRAAWKIDGLVVTPLMCQVSIRLLQVAGVQALAGQVVQPQGHPLPGQIGERVGGVLRGGHDRCPFLLTGWVDAGEQVSCGRGRAPGSPRRRGPARRRAARCSVRVPGSRRPARPWPRRRSPRR